MTLLFSRATLGILLVATTSGCFCWKDVHSFSPIASPIVSSTPQPSSCGTSSSTSTSTSVTMAPTSQKSFTSPLYSSSIDEHSTSTINSTSPSNTSTGGTSSDVMETTNLYEEIRDMASLSFLVYTFAYITDVARALGENSFIEGLNVSNDGKVTSASTTSASTTPRDLPRSFTPKEIRNIIEKNRDILQKRFDFAFGDNLGYQLCINDLKTMEERAEQYRKAMAKNNNTNNDNNNNNIDYLRPLTLEEFDDKHQSREMVYGVTKDDVNKRITLVFRGTENELSMTTNWSTNLYMSFSKAWIPDIIQNNNVISKLDIHSGFLNYVFSPTVDPTDDSTFRKYDEILQDVKELLAAYPGYKLYVTGHSLGAALATLVSFYLTCDPEIPKPVTCINFASPRVGDQHFLEAVRWLEEQGMLRLLRVLNDKDSVAHFPILSYKHVGFQARMYREVGIPPTITYPKKTKNGWNVERMIENSFIRNFNLGYDHGDYRERVDKDKEFLSQLDWDKLYSNSTLTGFGEN